MSEQGATTVRTERRWQMALAVLVATGLQLATPHGGRVPGWWLFPVLELLLLPIIIAIDPGKVDDRSVQVRRLTIGLIAIMTVGTMAGVTLLAYDILSNTVLFHAPTVVLSATDLFGRGAALWVTNVIVFSLWFWELDRGGPAERAAASGIPPSFAFPENAMPEFAAEGWSPIYPDYLYLAFTNATAFSPTDSLPVKTWAKMAMMLQSVVSLVTAILVVARAINVLPG
jgi:hypothetical protein